jgi:acyl-CoA synthetase (AMP-forming)/AMP-acid ligase II
VGAWAAANDRDVSLTEPAADHLVAVFATGGTTGVPKGVCYSYRTLSAIAGNYVELADHPDPVFLAAAPLTHVSGRVCLGVMAAGGTTVVLPRFDPAAVFDAIERHRVTNMMLPTTLLTRLLAHPAAETSDTSSLARVFVGASPVPVELIRRALEVLGPVVTQNYGQTEAPMYISTMRPEDYFVNGDISAGELMPDERLASCGRPTSVSRIRLIGADDTDVEVGEIGEILVKGAFVMDGYLDDGPATEAVSLDGWHRTGDLGTLDEEGFLRIVGRLKDLIITGGFNVYPAEIEAVIAERPDVYESAVVGVPDPDWGERVVAAIEPTANGECDVEGLLDHVRARLGAVKTPKEVVILDELPRNANGKLLKRVLVEELVTRDISSAR